MVGATIISTPMVVILTLNDSVTTTPVGYLSISTTAAFDTIGEVVLTR